MKRFFSLVFFLSVLFLGACFGPSKESLNDLNAFLETLKTAEGYEITYEILTEIDTGDGTPQFGKQTHNVKIDYTDGVKMVRDYTINDAESTKRTLYIKDGFCWERSFGNNTKQMASDTPYLKQFGFIDFVFYKDLVKRIEISSENDIYDKNYDIELSLAGIKYIKNNEWLFSTPHTFVTGHLTYNTKDGKLAWFKAKFTATGHTVEIDTRIKNIGAQSLVFPDDLQ